MLSPLLLPDLRIAIEERDWETIAAFGEELHPRDVSELLESLDESEAVHSIFEHWDPEVAANVLEYLPPHLQDELVERLDRTNLARMLEKMSHDERADLVKRMDEAHQEIVLPLVAKAEREDIRRLVAFDEGTAGAVMTSDYAALPASLTVSEALQHLRHVAPNRETIYYLYVLDSDRRLLGHLSLRDLVLAPPYHTVERLMRADAIFVTADSPVREAARLLGEYDLLALPVVDAERRLVGIITHDDAMDIVEEEATEDIHKLGAVAPIEENYLETDVLNVWRKRVVWLALLFVAELSTFSVMAHYDEALKTVSALVFFVPLVLATGGNSGSQAATLMTRAIGLGQVTLSDWRRVMGREILVGTLLGTALGAIGLLRCSLSPETVLNGVDRWTLSVAVGLAVAGVCLWGSLIGAVLPLLFKRIKVDPALASSPFVATFVDVSGMLIYFNVARWFLNF
jgi:magnesium transporter